MKKTSIYIVDDDKDILEALSLFFDVSNFEVYVYESGENILLRTKNLNPDIIILDLLLSGIDGGDIAQALKSEKETKNIPIIMMSAHPQAEKRAHDSGADFFIAKPFDSHYLLSMVNSILANRK